MSTPTQARPSLPELVPVFQELLPVKMVYDQLKASGKRFYERLFTPLVVLWGLIFQRLNKDHTCDAALAHFASGEADGLDTRHEQPLSERIKSESTAGYCKERQRLPLKVVQGALKHTGAVIQQWLGPAGLWLGHRVNLLDGTTFRLWPTPELVKTYGQHTNQHGSSYWVVMRAVVAQFS